MKMVEVVFASIDEKIVILKARRKIVLSSNCALTMETKLLKRCLTTSVKWILRLCS